METAWQGPPLFGGAGVVIGLGHTLGDGLRLRAGALKETFEGVDKQTFLAACPGRPVTGWEPAPKTALAVAFFAAQYFFSGALATTVENPFGIPNETPRVAVDVVLAVSGLAAWWGFDRTAQGFRDGEPHRAAGPAAEIFPDQRRAPLRLRRARRPGRAYVDTLGVLLRRAGGGAPGASRARRAPRRAPAPRADGGRRALPRGERRGARRRAGSKPRAYARRLGTYPHAPGSERAPAAGPTRAAEGEGDRGSGGRRRRERERGELREL